MDRCIHRRIPIPLVAKFEQGDGTDYIDEAIVLDREALELFPPGHPVQSMSLNSPAAGLFTRYKHLGKMEDLDEAIVLGREALELYPPGHADRWLVLNKLALRTSIRCKQLGVVDDEAVEYDRPSLCAEGVCRSVFAESTISFSVTKVRKLLFG